jgi:predicted MFS family arabinose efflux permease
VFVQALVDHGGLSPAVAGYTLSVEMSGIAASTIGVAFLARRLPWRIALAVALSLMVLGNLASIAAIGNLDLLRATRLVTGLGAGLVVPLGFATLGRTAAADRNFGLSVLAVLVYATVVIPLIPPLVGWVGIGGMFGMMAGTAALAFGLLGYVPAGGATQSESATRVVDPGPTLRLAALGAMFAYFFAQGVFWSFAALAGRNGGLAEQEVANAIAISQFAGIAGAACAASLGARFGRALPLGTGIILGAVTVACMASGISVTGYTIAMFGYNFAWNLCHPYLLAVIARFDADGRHITYAVAMHKLGLAAGPAAGAAVLTQASYGGVTALSLAAFGVSLILILAPALRQRAIERSVRPDIHIAGTRAP